MLHNGFARMHATAELVGNMALRREGQVRRADGRDPV